MVADVVRAPIDARAQTPTLFTIRLILVGLMALVVFLIVTIAITGGTSFAVGGTRDVGPRRSESAARPLAAGDCVDADQVAGCRFASSGHPARRSGAAAQTLMIIVATFAVTCLPLIIQAFRLAASRPLREPDLFLAQRPSRRRCPRTAPWESFPSSVRRRDGRPVSTPRTRSNRKRRVDRLRALDCPDDGTREVGRHGRGPALEVCRRGVCALGARPVPDGRRA